MQTKICKYNELNKKYASYEEVVPKYLATHPRLNMAFLKQQKKYHPNSELPLFVSDQMRIINKLNQTSVFSEKIIQQMKALEQNLVELEIIILGL
jgi:hypothetical protein